MPRLYLIIFTLSLLFANFLTAKEHDYELTPIGVVVRGRNYGLVPMPGQAMDAETQLARLEDFMNAGYDAEAAKRAREYYGDAVPIEHISEEDKSFFVGAAFARIKGVPNNPEAYWLAQKAEVPDEDREQLFELLGAELQLNARKKWDKAQAQKVLHAVWLYDEDEECRRLVDESSEYGVYAQEALRKQDATLHCFGEDYARAVAPDQADEPYSLLEQTLARMPEERRGVYQGEFDRLRMSGRDSRQDYYALYGRLVRDEVRWQYAEKKKLISAVDSSLKSSTSIIPWRAYLSLVEKQELQYNRKLSERQKREIYNHWCKKIKDAQHQKQVETEACLKKRKKAVYIIISSLLGIALIVCIIFASYKKRFIIYRYIQPGLRPFPLIACSLLAIATANLPYGYYTFLRIVLSIWGITSIIQAYKEEQPSSGKTTAIIISSGILILYNPIIPIHLDRETWLPLNLISTPLILLTTYLTQRKPQS